MPLWDALAGLGVTVDGYLLERAELQTASGWTRVTTTVVLAGAGETGRGEDVTYTAPDHDHVPADLPLEGERSLDEYSRHLDGLEIWRGDPANTTSRDHRRWAFESAALDLAFRQAGRSSASSSAARTGPSASSSPPAPRSSRGSSCSRRWSSSSTSRPTGTAH